jgi:hypothetical protein
MTDEEIAGIAGALQLLLGDKTTEEKREAIYAAFPNEMVIFLHDVKRYVNGGGLFADMLYNDRAALDEARGICDGIILLDALAQARIRDLLSSVNLRRMTLAKLLGLKY